MDEWGGLQGSDFRVVFLHGHPEKGAEATTPVPPQKPTPARLGVGILALSAQAVPRRDVAPGGVGAADVAAWTRKIAGLPTAFPDGRARPFYRGPCHPSFF